MQEVQSPVLFLASIFISKYRRVVTLALRPRSMRNKPPIFNGKEAIIISRKLRTTKDPGRTKHYGEVENSE
jgi:hypothetical protein